MTIKLNFTFDKPTNATINDKPLRV